MSTLRKLWAFFKRDWQLALTYRYTFLIEVAQTFALLLSFFFIGRLFTGTGPHPLLAPYEGDYFRFVLLGIVFTGFMSTAMGSPSRTIGFERGNGTLQVILLTPTSFTTVALGKTLWDVSLLTGKVAIYLLAGAFLFRADLSHANWFAIAPVVALTVSVFLGLGMLSAGFFMVTRESAPFGIVFGWASRFLAGVYFPIAIFPEWMRQLSAWLPLTYTLEAVRKSLITGAPVQAIAKELTVLLGFCVLLLPAGILFFRWALDQTRRQGGLGFED